MHRICCQLFNFFSAAQGKVLATHIRLLVSSMMLCVTVQFGNTTLNRIERSYQFISLIYITKYITENQKFGCPRSVFLTLYEVLMIMSGAKTARFVEFPQAQNFIGSRYLLQHFSDGIDRTISGFHQDSRIRRTHL